MEKENKELKRLLQKKEGIKSVLGDSKLMKDLVAWIEKVSNHDANILIEGEIGTGKDLVAKAIHYNSNRSMHPFRKINCASIPKDSFESELFGYEKGAFTGAISRKIGKFEHANGGTIFLDEIGDMSLAAQAKVLRALQENVITRVGSDKTIKVNVRVIAATNKNLRKEIDSNNFREDTATVVDGKFKFRLSTK